MSPSSAAAGILDDDISLSMAPVTVNEGDGVGQAIISLPGPTESPIIFHIAPSGGTATLTHFVPGGCVFGVCFPGGTSRRL